MKLEKSWRICGVHRAIECTRKQEGTSLDITRNVDQIWPMSLLTLPSRKERQSLHGYVREHLQRLEQELCVGVPYQALANAVLAAGFTKVALRSIQNAVYRARKKRPAHADDPARSAAAVFTSPTPNPWAIDPLPSYAKGDRAAIGRRFRDLARPPNPGADEPDPLV